MRATSGFPVTLRADGDNSLMGSIPNGVNHHSLDLPDHNGAALDVNRNPRSGLPYLNASAFRQTVEQDDGGFHFIGGHFQPRGIDNRGNRLVATTRQTLALADRGIGGSIEEQAGDQLASNPLLLDEVA
jgi:hypothetical protein